MSLIDTYRQRGRELNARDNENKFAIGDWQLSAERALGEAYDQVLSECFTISEERLKTYRKVAEAFPPESRVRELSWQHHHVVCRKGLDVTAQRALLQMAVANQWSSRELSEHAKETASVQAVLRKWDLGKAREKFEELQDRWPPECWPVLVNLCRAVVEEHEQAKESVYADIQ